PKILAIVTAGLVVGLLTFSLEHLKEDAAKGLGLESRASVTNPNPSPVDALHAPGGVLDHKHMANLGRHLFSEQLLSVELAGTLLLVALVGAVAIALHGRGRLDQRIEEALR